METGPGAPGAVRFADVVREVSSVARAANLVVPVFRTPPRYPGAARTIRRLRGGPVVSVCVKGRSASEIVTDLIDGVLVANRLSGASADALRQSLRAALGSPSDASRAA
ncbi:MAG TPA: hypothetical protein VFR41_02305 [Acidimicrobiia bacterium]|nr:hypothetical protein [Acidimicrobiia bacterium]